METIELTNFYFESGKTDQTFACVALDYSSPLDENRAILNKPETKGVPVYYVIGNHEIDCCHLENVLKFYSLDKPYYSFKYNVL